MDIKSFILCLFGLVICMYGLITTQFLFAAVCLFIILGLVYLIETVIPALVAFVNTIQQLAEDVKAIRNRLDRASEKS